jgi:NADH-quinone oxidoreductase subunit N
MMTEVFRTCGPELTLLGTAVLLILAETIFPRIWGRGKGYLALVGTAGAFLLLERSLGAPPELFQGAWTSDWFSVVFKMILLMATVLVLFTSLEEGTEKSQSAGEFSILVLLAAVGMMVMVSGANLLVIYLGLELMAISFYILAGFSWYREEASEGSLKYVLTGLFASAILLYGVSFLYGAAGTVGLEELRVLLGTGSSPRGMVLAGMALLVCGLAFKMGAAPFHMWMPDTLEGAPTPVAGFLAVGPKIAVLAVAARIFLTSFSALHEFWGPLFWTISALTIFWGNLAAIAQAGVKRMLAYSSIAHVGYLLIALVAAGSRMEEGTAAIAFYLAAYTFMNLGAFGTLLWFEKKTGESVTWRGLAGMHRRAPLMSLLFSLFMFSLAGIPPMAGFIGKFWVFVAGWRAGHYGLVLIGAAGSLVGSFYYLRTIYALYMLPDEEGPRLSTEFSPLVCALLLMALGVLAIGVAPQFVMVLAGRAIPY